MDVGIIVHTLILNDEGKLLVLKRQPADKVLPGFWDIPGGTLEAGEDPVVGAKRETKEECGLEVNNLQLAHFTSNNDSAKNKQFVRLIFTARAEGHDIKLNSEEHDDYCWIDPAQPDNLPYVDYLPECFRILIDK